MPHTRIAQATKHLSDILHEAIHLSASEQAVVIFDTQSALASILVAAYKQALPTGTFIDFDTLSATEVMDIIQHLRPNDLVVLVQSTNFRLDEFRIRIELFKRELKTIEHIHLARMDESQFDTYIDALSYDSTYYRNIGPALKTRLDQAQKITVKCAGTELVYNGPMESSKLNIGDYTGMKNTGGTFPIGEVFTEARDLQTVQGEALVFGFAGEDHVVRVYEPFLVKIQDGVLTSPDGPDIFQHILRRIKEDEEVLVREFGLGLNRAMNRERLVNDITAFERQSGLHLSLGAKHAMYPKPGLKRKEGRYHVDIFVAAEQIVIDETTIFEHGTYTQAAYST